MEYSKPIEEFDANVIFCSLDSLKKIFPQTHVTQINVRLQPHKAAPEVLLRLKKRLRQLDIFSWKELYPALVSALVLEKYAMFLILALITLVASMNIVALLFMYITHKKNDIALLQAMGLSETTLEQVFIIVGMGIAFVGTVIGIIGAWLASWFLETYPFITLPDIYYTSHLPAQMDWRIVLNVCLVSLIVSFFASWLPARRIRSISIAEVLKTGE